MKIGKYSLLPFGHMRRVSLGRAGRVLLASETFD